MTCHLCASPLDAAPIVGTIARGGRPSRRVACVRCGLVQVSPQPSAEELHAYYTSGDYHREHGPVTMCITHPDGRQEHVEPHEPGYPDAIDTMHRSRARAVVADLALTPGARALEIGCSDGRTLAELQRLGMDVYGVEPDASMVEAARDRIGSDVWLGTIDDVGIAPFDAIVAFHVLEHVPDPLAWLAKIRQRLRPGGRVWFEVPNVLTPAWPLTEHWQWVHLYDFSPHTIAALLARAGFDGIHISDRGPLRAWATDDGAEPRAFEDHGGPDGATLADALAGAEPVTRDHRSPLLAYIEAAPPEVRSEWERYQAATHRIAAAYRDATHALGELGTAMQADAEARLESYHPDDYVHGYTIGEATARRYAGALVVHVANAMRVLELTDGERG